MKKPEDFCCKLKSCRYHSTRTDSAPVGDCRYLDVTGKTKLGQMTPEQRRLLHEGLIQCPMYEDGVKLARRRMDNNLLFPQSKRPRQILTDVSRMEELYKEGLHDAQIAERLGISRYSVCHWRRNNNLPANSPRGFHHDKRELLKK